MKDRVGSTKETFKPHPQAFKDEALGLYGEEIFDNNVPNHQVDLKQNAHWLWCSNACRLKAKKRQRKSYEDWMIW